MDQPKRYRAFLSYSHKDKDQAIAWQQRLEAFDIHWGFDDHAATPLLFKPVFRDETDLPLGEELGPAIRANLDASDSLILIGSPNARNSQHVAAEVAYFRSKHPNGPQPICILAGPPGTAFHDHLPDTLAFELDGEGKPTAKKCAPISVNPHTEGEAVCAARVIGRALNLDEGRLAKWVREIKVREAADEKARQDRDALLATRPKRAAIMAAVAVLLLALGVSSCVVWVNGKADDRRHEQVMGELQRLATVSGAIERGKAQGIPEPAIRAIVERIGGQGIGAEDLVRFLDNWIEHARTELRRHENAGAAYEAAFQEAQKRFNAGHLTAASEPFMDELRREQEADAKQQAASRRRKIALLETAIEFDIRAINVAASIPKLRMIATIEGIDRGDALGAWLDQWATARYGHGRDKGDNVALLAAIAGYFTALEEFSSDRAPQARASTQNKLGIVLLELGARERGTARLEQAVAAFRAASLERTRERVPQDWAEIQKYLGDAHVLLGLREPSIDRLREAVTLYRAALLERTRERVPQDWATIQNNLGFALRELGVRESDAARLDESVIAYRAALLESTVERSPRDWALTQSNFGVALGTLGAWESGTERLNEAVGAYRAAMLEYTRELVPKELAMLQYNLGNTLWLIGERRRDRAQQQEAIVAMRNAADTFRQEGNIEMAVTAGVRLEGMERLIAQ